MWWHQNRNRCAVRLWPVVQLTLTCWRTRTIKRSRKKSEKTHSSQTHSFHNYAIYEICDAHYRRLQTLTKSHSIFHIREACIALLPYVQCILAWSQTGLLFSVHRSLSYSANGYAKSVQIPAKILAPQLAERIHHWKRFSRIDEIRFRFRRTSGCSQQRRLLAMCDHLHTKRMRYPNRWTWTCKQTLLGRHSWKPVHIYERTRVQGNAYACDFHFG